MPPLLFQFSTITLERPYQYSLIDRGLWLVHELLIRQVKPLAVTVVGKFVHDVARYSLAQSSDDVIPVVLLNLTSALGYVLYRNAFGSENLLRDTSKNISVLAELGR